MGGNSRVQIVNIALLLNEVSEIKTKLWCVCVSVAHVLQLRSAALALLNAATCASEVMCVCVCVSKCASDKPQRFGVSWGIESKTRQRAGAF